MTSENLCESQVLSWRHRAKFCVSHGGFGAMSPAPLDRISSKKSWRMQVSPQYRRKLHLCQSQIQFFLGREGPAKLARMVPLATSLSTDLLTS